MKSIAIQMNSLVLTILVLLFVWLTFMDLCDQVRCLAGLLSTRYMCAYYFMHCSAFAMISVATIPDEVRAKR